MSDSGDFSKPRVIILGGCGFIGRNMVEHLITNNLVTAVRVVDKTPPQLAWLNPHHTKVFEDPRVEYRSANLINPASCEDIFSEGPWTLAINCAGETRIGQPAALYEDGIAVLGGHVAKQCAERDVRLVEISTAHVYNGDKGPHKEDGPIDPWTIEGRMKYKVEKEIRALAPGLRYTILRPTLVYGIGDRRSLTPRLLLGAIYKHLNETMKLLWTADLKLNTVHVSDLCRSIWLVGTTADAIGKTYNIVDDADSTQGSLAELVCEIFSIKHDYYGTAISTLAKNDLAAVAEEANEKHLGAWAELRRGRGATPLEPGTAPELLAQRHLHADPSAFRALPGAGCLVPRPTADLLRQVLEDFAAMDLFPKESLL